MDQQLTSTIDDCRMGVEIWVKEILVLENITACL